MSHYRVSITAQVQIRCGCNQEGRSRAKKLLPARLVTTNVQSLLLQVEIGDLQRNHFTWAQPKIVQQSQEQEVSPSLWESKVRNLKKLGELLFRSLRQAARH